MVSTDETLVNTDTQSSKIDGTWTKTKHHHIIQKQLHKRLLKDKVGHVIMRLGIKFCKWVCPNSQVKRIFKFFGEVWITQKQAAKQGCFRSISSRPKRSFEISTLS